MDATSSLASRLYAGLAPAVSPETAAAPGKSAVSDAAAFARSYAETLRAGEETAIRGLAGEADPHAVVAALAQTEIAVQTAVTVRDKVVEAYQEILRMPV